MADLHIEIDSRLHCPRCDDDPYIIYRRQAESGSLVYLNVIWPADPDIPPPNDPGDIRCPRCRERLVRK